MSLVLDASVALSWFLSRTSPDEAITSQQTLQKAMIEGGLVPQLWHWEVMNGLLTAERHVDLGAQAINGFLADLDSLPISLDATPAQSLRKQILPLALTFHLTAYDASYLELAIRTGSSLATFDRKLAQAAHSAGVSIFGDPS